MDTSHVAYRLVYHDLVPIPGDGDRAGIYWLRLYEGEADRVAVITEVPGNPGASVTNRVEEIVDHIRSVFATGDALRVYEVWPPGSTGSVDALVSRVVLGPSAPEWTEADRAEIEAIIGAALPALPGHEDLYRRVRDLGGGTLTEAARPVFEAYPVADLPPPHLPFRCQHRARFERMVRDIHSREGTSRAALLEVGRAFVASLTPADLLACHFHDGDWRSVADESVRIINQLGPQERAEYRVAALQARLPDRERGWLLSLFAQPIDIHRDSYSNGQHRGCALRFSGAECAAVVTHWEALGEEREDWVYVGGG